MHEETRAQWIKSSYSDSSGGQCVEWAPAHASAGNVPVRDSKDASQAQLSISTHVWAAFIHGVRQDTFTA